MPFEYVNRKLYICGGLCNIKMAESKFYRKIRKVGSSYVITIDRDAMEALHMELGDLIQITISKLGEGGEEKDVAQSS